MTLKYSSQFKLTSLVLFMLVGMVGCIRKEQHSFYCLSGGKCVTVMKRLDGNVYIIPGKYEDNNVPTVSHIKASHKQFLTLYFSEELPHVIIIRDEGNLESNQKKYIIENRENGDWKFLEYSEDHNAILYKPDAIKFNDVKKGTTYLHINIHENFAIDKTGEKVENSFK